MIPALLFAAAIGVAAFLGGCLFGGVRFVDRLADADRDRDEFARRLNRILGTQQPDAEPDSQLAGIYAIARGETV